MSETAASPSEKHRPRLQRWHLILWIVLIGFFTFISVRGERDEAFRKGRDIPIARYVWNAAAIHTGPSAGVLYWDWGYHSVSGVINQGARARIGGGANQAFVLIVTVVFITVLSLNGGIIPQPVSKWVHVVYGVMFVLVTALWYYSAALSLAALI